jgi:pilus assembly protein CpaE
VVDLDVQLGDVLTALDLTPQVTLSELLQQIDDIDAQVLRRRLAVHRSGAYALAQAGRLEQLSAVRPERIAALLTRLSRQFDIVVLDGLRDFGDLALAALDHADRVVLCLTEDVPAVRGAARCLEIFRRLGFGDDRLALVVNRHRRRAPLGPAAIADAVGLPVFATIASDFPRVESALHGGVPVDQHAPHAQVTRDLESLAMRLHAPRELLRAETVTLAPRRSLLGRLFGRGR